MNGLLLVIDFPELRANLVATACIAYLRVTACLAYGFGFTARWDLPLAGAGVRFRRIGYSIPGYLFTIVALEGISPDDNTQQTAAFLSCRIKRLVFQKKVTVRFHSFRDRPLFTGGMQSGS